jgi:cytosine/adenosine deaminase-related metal-dependent hydrolase
VTTVLEVGRLWARPWEGAPTGPARLHLENGRITRIEPGGRGTGLAMPGLVNAHDHARGVRPLAAGVADAPLEAWLWRLRRVPGVDPYLNAAVAFSRMARSGVVAVADLHLPTDILDPEEAAAVARAAREVGLTVAFVAPIVDRNLHGLDGGAAARAALGADWARLEESLPPVAEQVAIVDRIAEAQESETFVVQYGPAGPHWVSEEGWRLIAERSAATGRRVHTHLLETLPQRRWLDREHDSRPMEWFDRTNLLNDRLTVAHGVHLRPDECEALARAGATLAVNASSNLRLASGIAPGQAIRAANLRFGLGIDGLSLADDDDMLAEVRLAARLLGGFGHDRAGLPAVAFLQAAASWGRRTIDGSEGLGLVEGALADIVVLNEEVLAPDRLSDGGLPELILGRMAKNSVLEVYARGRRIVRNGRPTGVDLDALETELYAQGRRAAPDPGLARLLDRAELASTAAIRQAMLAHLPQGEC